MQQAKTIANAVTCKWCGVRIESVHRHDFQGCACEDEQKRIYVDGGKDYCRRVFGENAWWVEEGGEEHGGPGVQEGE